MRYFEALLLFAIALLAHGAGPSEPTCKCDLVRGHLLEWDATEPSGELSIRAADNHVFRFRFDGKTEFELEKRRIAASGLRKGDALEIQADRWGAGVLGYARIVHVIEPPSPAPVPIRLGSLRICRSPFEQSVLPLGYLTFSGVVCCLNGERFILHTRLDGEKTILLRQDTWYLKDGSQAEASTLKPNMRVFVRARRNFENELEACHVIWGVILEPGAN